MEVRNHLSRPQFKDEILRALREFFNQPDLKPGGKLELRSEADEKMFNEKKNKFFRQE